MQKSPLSLYHGMDRNEQGGIMHNQTADTPVISPVLEVSERVPTRQRADHEKKRGISLPGTSSGDCGIKISRSERFFV